jgi:hypothetical protein
MFALLLSILAAVQAPQSRPETRCGWLANPTPANYWLTDRDGEWMIMVQGGYQADGWDEMPDMTTAGWVETNGHYGYGCACMRVIVDRASGRVTRLFSARPVALRQCQADPRLRRPD